VSFASPPLVTLPNPTLAFARLQQQRKRAKPRQKGKGK